jgi:ribosomal protein S18 acetylase RimI-like enzyme
MGRLAVSSCDRGKGYGEHLLIDALRRSLEHSPAIASFAVVVDAKDESAANFYKAYGFERLSQSRHRYYLPMATVEELFPRM